MSLAWRSRRRFWKRRDLRIIESRSGIGGTRAVYASKITMGWYGAPLGGRVGRPTWGGRRRICRVSATGLLGNGLSDAENYEDALSVQEAELAMMRRLGAAEVTIIITQNNLASTYGELGRDEDALRMQREVYSGHMRIHGEEHYTTLVAAANYAACLGRLKRVKETKVLMRKTIPVARRVLGGSHELLIRLGSNYAGALFEDPNATLDDIREAVTTLEDLERTARRVLGGAHPFTGDIERNLRVARAALTSEGDDVSALRAALDAMGTT